MVRIRIELQLVGPNLFGIRAYIDDEAKALTVTRIDPEDQLENRLQQLLEDHYYAPNLHRVEAEQTLKYMTERGLSLAVSALVGTLEESKLLLTSPWTLELIGSDILQQQAWELMRLDSSGEPIAINRPLVRRIVSTQAWGTPPPLDGESVNILLLTCRTDTSIERPPRLISGPLSAIAKMTGKRLLWTNLTGALPARARQLIEQRTKYNILHVDAHGIFLTYEKFTQLDSIHRRAFQSVLELPPVSPYEGEIAFVNLDEGDGFLPVSGKQLAHFARQLGIHTILLNSCRAGKINSNGSLAADLVRVGISDVVAFRHNLTERGAELFCIGFYNALAQGLEIEHATVAARRLMYEQRTRMVRGELIEVPDWASLVHYSVEEGGRSLQPLDHALPIPPLVSRWEPWPVAVEWSIFSGCRALVRQSYRDQSAKNLIYVGPLGNGADSVAIEAASWLVRSDILWKDFIIVDMRQLLDNSTGDFASYCDAISREFAEEFGPEILIVVLGSDTIVSKGDLSAIQYFFESLGRRHLSSISGLSRWWHERQGDPLAAELVFGLSPLTLEDVMTFGANATDDPEMAALREAAYWAAGYYGEILAIIKELDRQGLEVFLDHFTFGTICSPDLEEKLFIIREPMLHRLGSCQGQEACRSDDPLTLLLAAIGPGLSYFDLERFAIAESDFSSQTEEPLKERIRQLLRYVECGLAAPPSPHRWILKWREHNFAMGWLVHPLLRVAARQSLGPEVLESLDRQALEFATMKLSALHRAFDVAESREEAKLFFYIGQPFWIASLWTSKRRGWDVQALLEEIFYAQRAGLWPLRLDVSVIQPQSSVFQPQMAHENVEGTAENGDIFALTLERALQLRDSGRYTEALEAAHRAVDIAAQPEARALALLQLGTILIDTNSAAEADEAFRKAEMILHRHGPYGLLAEAIFERANVLDVSEHGADSSRQKVEARYREAIEMAQETGQYDISCRCYINLAERELRIMPFGVAVQKHPPELRHSLLQAEDYIRRAEEAAQRADSLDVRKPAILALKARIAAVRGESGEMGRLIEEAQHAAQLSGIDKELSALRNLEFLCNRSANHTPPPASARGKPRARSDERWKG